MAIAQSVERRIYTLAQLAMMQAGPQTQSTDDDVEENVAEHYGPKLIP